jgi:hypothetical protein
VSRQRYFSDYGRGVSRREQHANIIPYLVIALLALLALVLTRVAPPEAAINISGRVLDS